MKLLIITHDINSQGYQLYNLVYALHSRVNKLEILSFSPPDYSLKFMLNYNKIKVHITHFPWAVLFSKYKNGNYDLKAQELYRQASIPHLAALREQVSTMDCLIFYGLQSAKIASEFQNIRKVLITNESLDENISSFRTILGFLKRHINQFICTRLEENKKLKALALPSQYLPNCLDPLLELQNISEEFVKAPDYTYFTTIMPTNNEYDDNLERLLVAMQYLKDYNTKFRIKIYQPYKLDKVLKSLDLTEFVNSETWDYSYKKAFAHSDCLINLENNELSTIYAHKHAQAILSLTNQDYIQEYNCGKILSSNNAKGPSIKELSQAMLKIIKELSLKNQYQENSLKLYAEKYNFRENISNLEHMLF